MASPPPVTFRLYRPPHPLPVVTDFCNPGPGDAVCSSDAEYAWRNFGNLTLAKAYQLFLEAPWTYQEDFMWMFTPAFAYYFPVIDKYLREVQDEVSIHNGCEAWILGCGVRSQFQWADGHKPPPNVVEEIRDLSTFVQANVDRYSDEPEERERIIESWRKVEEEVAICKGGSNSADDSVT